MQHVATVNIQNHPSIDSVLVWDDGSRLIAYAYQGGRVVRTTPLETTSLNHAKIEARQAFGIPEAQWEQREQVQRWR